MQNYLVLREKVRAFRGDPEVVEAMAAVRWMGFERLDRLAMDHLLGARWPDRPPEGC